MKTLNLNFFRRVFSARIVVTGFLGAVLLMAFQNCSTKKFEIYDSQQSTQTSTQSSKDQLVAEFEDGKVDAGLINLKDISIAFRWMRFPGAPVDQTVSFECALDKNLGMVPCASPYPLKGLTDGPHEFRVRVVSSSGLRGDIATRRFTIDATPPTIQISSAPPAVFGGTEFSVVFAATDNLSGVSSIECSFDGATYATCQSPLILKSLNTGNHTLSIRARDNATNLSTVATAGFKVDTSVPVVTISQSPPIYSKSKTASFTFSGTSGGQAIGHFLCNLDSSQNLTSCSSPMSFTNLQDGPHEFFISGQSVTGISSAVQTVRWIIDTTLPVITFQSKPPLSDLSVSASFQFTVTEAGSGVKTTECQLDGGTFTSCAGTYPANNLAIGSHSFVVRSQDNAGNIGTSQYTWTVTTAPSSVTLAWDPVSDTRLTGYKLYYGNSPGTYSASITVNSSTTTAKVDNLVKGKTYYFAVTALGGPQEESVHSNEVSFTAN